MNSADIPIRDIKPLLPIPDISIYLFSAIVAISFLLITAAAIYGWHTWQKQRKKDPRIEWLNRLESIDYENPKKAAYIMTRYGRLLAEEKRQKEIMEQLLPRLQKYKYRRVVPSLDEETKRFMKLFIEMTKDAF